MKRSIPVLALALLALVAADKKKPMPDPGQVFSFEPNSFKYVNSDIEFRDPSDAKWPSFFYGKPARGTHVYDAQNPSASLEVPFDRMTQDKGDQSRRVMGDYCQDGRPPVIVAVIRSMSPMRMKTIDVQGKKGIEQKQVEISELALAIEIAQKTIVAIKPDATFTYHANKQGRIERVTIESRVRVTAGQLGLTSMDAAAPIDIRLTINGSAMHADAPK